MSSREPGRPHVISLKQSPWLVFTHSQSLKTPATLIAPAVSQVLAFITLRCVELPLAHVHACEPHRHVSGMAKNSVISETIKHRVFAAWLALTAHKKIVSATLALLCVSPLITKVIRWSCRSSTLSSGRFRRFHLYSDMKLNGSHTKLPIPTLLS